MSDTVKTAEAFKKATDQAAKFGQATTDTADKVTKETVNATSQATMSGVDRAKGVNSGITETVTETAEVAVKAAEQSREMMLMGARTAADVGSRVADLSFGRGHDLMASTATAMDTYRGASERSAERVQALFSSYMRLGRGLQHMQKVWFELVDHSMENAVHKPQDLLRCKNIVELAEVQRDLYIDAVNHAVQSTSRLLEIAGRTAQDAAGPLQSHKH